MAGGLIQLVAYGQQDLYLTGDPEITFFKVVYRRHTNFTLEAIQQDFIDKPDFGKRVSCVISRYGDIVRKMHLVVELPSIPKFKNINNTKCTYQKCDSLTKFAWVRRIGFAIIKTVEIEIGGEIIDRQYGDWLNIWYELTVPDNHSQDKMIGDVEELTDFSNGKKSYKLFIPLQFWFNRIAGLALPVVSLQYSHIKINLDLNDFSNCYILSPTHYINIENDFVNFEPSEYLIQNVNGVISLAKFIHYDIIEKRLYISKISCNSFIIPSCINTNLNININKKYEIYGLTSEFRVIPKVNTKERIYKNKTVNLANISLKKCFLLVEYGFLDDSERTRFSRARHEYLIEQIFFNGTETINGLHQSFKVGFTQSCKELIWISQLESSIKNNDWFNYTDSLISNGDNGNNGKNIITSCALLFNGVERLSTRDIGYFSKLQIYQNHSHGASEGINVYSFALHPENHQPSGTVNLTMIDNVKLRLSVIPKINSKNVAKLRIYGITYNILRISNGISGLLFQLDF